jgi:hypothetical protein
MKIPETICDCTAGHGVDECGAQTGAPTKPPAITTSVASCTARYREATTGVPGATVAGTEPCKVIGLGSLGDGGAHQMGTWHQKIETTGTDGDHQVIPFRARTSASAPLRQAPRPEPEDLSAYERTREPDDYRHRMIMNVAAGIFTVALTAFGIWLALSIADLRKTTDCILIGRRDCAVIPAHHR